METKTILISFLFIFLNTSLTFAQTLVNYPTGSVSPNVVASNMFVTNITAGPGITPVACSRVSAEGFNQTKWSNALNSGDYWTLTITPDNGYDINISNITIKETGSTRMDPTPLASRTLGYKIGNGSWQYIAAYGSTNLGTNICTHQSSGNNSNFTINTASPITIGLAYWANPTTPFQARMGQFTITGTVSLPIELIKFEGKEIKTGNVLSWKTATEINNAYFNIEHSTNAHSFQSIGKINGAGNSTIEQNYRFTHETPTDGTNYYRLKQTDYDGKFTYSKVISINIKKENQIQIFPNPTNGKLNINAPYLKKAKIEVLNTMGEVVKTIPYEGQEIDLSNLSTGVYYLVIHTEKGVERIPVVKE